MIKTIKKGFEKFTSLPKKIKILFIVAVCIIMVVLFVKRIERKTEAFETEKVKKADITEIVDETGTVTTSSKTDVYSPSKGIVEELYISNGDIVGIGQNLFKVKSTATEDEKATALANLLSAQSSLKTAEQNKMAYQVQLEQARKAVLDARADKDDLINDTSTSYTQLEKDAVDSALTSAYWNFNTLEKKYVETDVAISAAKASVSSYNFAYESTKDRVIVSPAIGTVSNLSVTMGDAVTAYNPASTTSILGLSATTSPVLSIVNFASNNIVAKINETDISDIKVGQKVVIDPDALQDAEYSGIIARVDDIGSLNQEVVTYNVYIDLLDADEKLKSGMTVDVSIVTNTAKNVLSVPNTAVKPYKGGRAVRIYNQKTKEIEYVPVTIGVKGESRTEIVSGLTEGQEIITTLSSEQVKKNLFGM